MPNDPTRPAADWHARDAESALAALQTTPHGLTAAEAASRLQRFGPNRLAEAPPESPLIRLAPQFDNQGRSGNGGERHPNLPGTSDSFWCVPEPFDRMTVARDAWAYFATFCSASSTEKYTADSASWEKRPTPSDRTSTGTAERRAWASSAAGRPWSASSGG